MFIRKRDLSPLSIKNIGIYNQGDQKALRDSCVVCGQFTEDLNPKTKRCNRPECRGMLIKEALKRKLAIRNGNNIIGCFDDAIQYMPGQNTLNVMDAPNEICRCGKSMKMAEKNLCPLCLLKRNKRRRKK